VDLGRCGLGFVFLLAPYVCVCVQRCCAASVRAFTPAPPTSALLSCYPHESRCPYEIWLDLFSPFSSVSVCFCFFLMPPPSSPLPLPLSPFVVLGSGEMFFFDDHAKPDKSGEFDDMVIAPVFGFDDYQDYYRKTQSGQFLKGVRVPFLAVQVRVRPLSQNKVKACLFLGRKMKNVPQGGATATDGKRGRQMLCEA